MGLGEGAKEADEKETEKEDVEEELEGRGARNKEE